MTQRRFYFYRFLKHETGVAFAPVLICLITAFLSTARLDAQVMGGISGAITDQTGAVVAGASITAVNSSTGIAAHAVSGSVGTFILTALTPGHYSVTVDAPGFKRLVRKDIVVEVAKESNVDLQLAPGAANQIVTVTGHAISLNTTSPQIGTTLEPALLNMAPIEITGLARQIDSFIYLAPGVQGSASAHNINGGVTFENEIQFNGVPIVQVSYQGNQTNINPPYEMVNEFRVDSSTFSAQYGLSQGAVTYNMASGTNLLHGDAFEILRNQLFDSDGFFPIYFRPDGHPAPPINQQNNYGFTVSGPVMVPKLYNGKNRTFFLFSSDWFRQNQAQTSVGTVPTPAMKTGDFSNFVDANGKQIPIYDPQTGAPFPGNIIPQGRFSALSKSILPMIPDPDRAGLVSGLQANKSPAVRSLPIKQYLWGYTIDHNLTQSQSIRFSQWEDTITSPSFSQAPIVAPTNELQSLINEKQHGSGYLLNYVYTVTPHLVASAGVSSVGQITGQDNGLTGDSFPGVANSTTFPSIGFDGSHTPTDWGAWGSYTGGFTETNSRNLGIGIVNNWLWTKGRHTFNIGGEFRRQYSDAITCLQCGGTFLFSQRTTSTPNTSDPNFGSYGSSFASFLLGEADSATRIYTDELKLRNRAFSFYTQDNIQLNKRLSVNLGLRWDIMVPFTESNNEVIYVDPEAPDPGAGNIPGGATKFGHCDGCAGITRAAIHWKQFGPRLGVSYLLNKNTVIRSGFYLDYLNGGAYEFGTDQVSFYMGALLRGIFATTPTNTSVPSYGSWDANTMPSPSAAPFTPSIGNGKIITAFDPKGDGAAPYLQSWNLSVERQLPWDMFLSLAYVGNRVIHLPVTIKKFNQPNPSVLQYGALLGQPVDSPAAIAAGIKIPYPDFIKQFGAGATVEQALTPYPQYSNVQNNYEHDGTAFYNAFQAQGEKRFTNGFSYLASLTLSRNMANASTGSAIFSNNGENAYNTRAEWGPSALDQLYNFKTVATYELPVGRGKRYLHSNNLLSQVAGGWRVSAILDYEGGNPFGPTNNLNPLHSNGFDRPNIVPGVPLKTYNYKLSKNYLTGKASAPPVQFPTNAFVNTGAFELGDAVRSYASLRTPPLRVENFNAMKVFHLGDRVTATLRVDYFNAFNRTRLEAPDTNSSHATFGQIVSSSSQMSNRQGQAAFRVEF